MNVNTKLFSSMIIRPLTIQDDIMEIKHLLSQLTTCQIKDGDDNSQYEHFWKNCITSQHNDDDKRFPKMFIYVCEIAGGLIGCASLIIECKISHNYGKVGHIEDVVIDETYRKLGYGKLLIQHVVNLAKDVHNCYKVILDCSQKNVIFYEKCGFSKKEVHMAMYFM